jgi:integrase
MRREGTNPRAPDELGTRVAQALSSGLDLHRIQSMERDELLQLQAALGYGNTWGLWQIPKGWAPRTGKTRFRLESVGTPSGDRIWTEAVRVVLLLSLTPSKHKTRNTWLKPPSVVQKGEIAVRKGRLIAEAKGPATSWWSRLQAGQVQSHIDRYFAASLRGLFERGLIVDAPPSPHRDTQPVERDRHGEVEPTQPADSSQEWQPLPDQFVSAMGQSILWFTQVLGPALLDCLEACMALKLPPVGWSQRQKIPGQRTKASEQNKMSTLRSRRLKAWQWATPDGAPLAAPSIQGISLIFKTPGSFISDHTSFRDFEWPPTKWAEIVKLVVTLQACHAWLLFLATGPRVSTIAEYTVDCLSRGPNGYRLAGIKWKNTREPGGQKRDWPLPQVLVELLNQQCRLASLIKKLANPLDFNALGNHLWVQIGQGQGTLGAPMTQFGSAIDGLSDVFGLRHLLGPEALTVHTHRFRKTLARILALALTSSQIVLMDVFGHEDPDQTLGYMLSDKAIVADVMRMQREIVILLAVDAVNQSETLGGPFGEVVREKVHEFLRVKGTDRLEPQDAYELADQLTLGGREWTVVMEGVICTLSGLDHGPCGAGKGIRRDMLNCQAGCSHQLILAYHKNVCDDRIAAIVAMLDRATGEENDLLRAELSAKLMNHLFRWSDVHDKWKLHPVVSRVFEDWSSASAQCGEGKSG